MTPSTSSLPGSNRLSPSLSRTAPLALEPAVSAAPIRGELDLPSPWRLSLGGSLRRARLAYEVAGPPGAPVVAVLGGISSGRHVVDHRSTTGSGWWRDLAGPGLAIDTERHRVIGVDFLGGNGSGVEEEASISTQDQARALRRLLDHLAVDRLHAFVGSSYGGMVGLAFAALFPERLARLVAISAPHRSHPRSTAWRLIQRRILRLARHAGEPRQGLALARALAMTTYRSAEELESRFDGAPQRRGEHFRFPVEGYLDARGQAFADSFDPSAFLRLSESIDLHRVDPAEVRVTTTLVAARSDELVPVSQVRQLARELGGPGLLLEIDSAFGHDAFLKEAELLGPILRRCLEQREVRQ